MSTLSEFVTVTITTVAQTPSQTGFGTPLVFAYHNEFVDKVRTYTRLEDAVADGIESTGNTAGAYHAMLAIFSQSPRPKQVKLGKRASAFTQSLRIVPATAVEGEVIRLSIGALGADLSDIVREIPASSTVALEIDALKIAIDALNLDVTCTDNTTSLDIVADVAGTLFDIADRQNLTLEDRTAAPAGLADDLDAVVLYDDDWYGLALDSNSIAEVQAIAAKVETYRKVFAYNNSDTICGTSSTSDVFSELEADALYRTFGLFSQDSLLNYSGAAWLGEGLPYPPGSSTWAFKTLRGVTVDRLSTTVDGNVKGKNGNTYTAIKGKNITAKGVSAAGEFIDIAVGRDWLQARLEEAVFGAITAVRKVPYTDNGVDIIKAAVKAVLTAGVRAGFLASFEEPTAPKVADVSDADRANRLLPDVSFSATLAGAIHAVEVSGVLSV